MSAKKIVLKPIPSKLANEFVKKVHYSWKVVNNSQLHFGVFYNWLLGGVMSYWPSTDKSKLIWLVENTGWNEFIELNRMAFTDILPKNSESRAIAISIKLIKKKAPHIKWIVSFADWTQCWDWTIYRAAGFDLSQIKENNQLVKLSNWELTYKINKKDLNHNIYKFKIIEELPWFMLRYIKLIQPNLQKNYEVLPYSRIKEMWASMYLWKKQ